MKNKIFFLILIINLSCNPVEYSEVKSYKDYFPIEIQKEKKFLVTNIVHNSFGKRHIFILPKRNHYRIFYRFGRRYFIEYKDIGELIPHRTMK